MWWCVMESSEGEEVGVCLGVVGETGVEGEEWREVEWAFGERNCVLGGLCDGSTVRWETYTMRREGGGKRVEWVDPSFSLNRCILSLLASFSFNSFLRSPFPSSPQYPTYSHPRFLVDLHKNKWRPSLRRLRALGSIRRRYPHY